MNTDDEALPDEETVACLNCGWGDRPLCTCGYCADCLENMNPEALAAHQEHCGPDEDTDPRRAER